MPDDEYRAPVDAARRQGRPVAQIVCESLRRTLAEERDLDPEERIAAVLRFARCSGPTGEIESLLDVIERGRSLS